ncbi:MAG TPA: hypothetical protein VFR34_03060, partial [Paracoccaceae bacterium]|nr:hypothetical protein [Paracoccaceae bacterium]
VGVLDCGLYRETLVTDANMAVRETNEADNVSEHFFFVPSSQGALNLNVRLNTPPGDPVLRRVLNPQPGVEVAAFNAPGPGPVTVTTHNVRVFTAPAGGGWVINAAPATATGPSGTVAAFTPALPVIDPPPAPARNLAYRLTFDPAFLGPSGEGLYPEEYNSKVTAIAADGCQIRQETLMSRILFERG